MAHTKSVQFYRNTTVIRPDTENNKTALTVAKETLDESGSKLDGELTLIRYKEDDEDPIKTLVGVYHKNGNTGTWSYLTEDKPIIPYGACDSTSTSTAFTVTVPGIDKLEDGVCCFIKNGVVTSAAGFTINVNGLGAKPSYSNMSAATADTTLFNVNYTMLFIYDSTRVEGGCWICYRGYNSDKDTIGYLIRHNNSTLPTTAKFYRYRILFTSADGTHYVPSNTSSSTNATSSRTVNQTPIDPFGEIVYYGTTTAINAEANVTATQLWLQNICVLGYSFNRTNAALTLSYPAPVYLKCAPQANGSAIIDENTPYVQTLPSINDGKIYIFLGIAYDATHVELMIDHPVYYHDGTGIRLWTGKDCYAKSELATVATSGSYNDLSNKPTNVSDFTNDAGYQTKQRILLYLKDVDTTTFKCTFRIDNDEYGNEISDEEALEIFNNLGNDIQINYDGALYHAFIEDGDRTFITISDDWYHYQFSTYCLANSGVYVYHTNTGEWNKDTIFTTPDDVMLNSHPANTITSSDITSWNNKEDKQKELLNISQNGNTITFTDSDNNTVTHAKVKTLLEDEGKEVIFKMDDYYFIPQYHEDGTAIWYYQCFAGDENTFNYFEIRWAPVSSSLYLNNVRTVGYVPTTRTINTKPLSSNITLTASDVGALSSSTVVPDSITYDSNAKKIYLKSGNTTMAEIDATAFIKDGMVSTVEIVDDDIVITFNTDAGQEPITIPLADIFDPDQYYTKSEIDDAHFVIAQALSDLDDRVTDGLSVWDCGDY